MANEVPLAEAFKVWQVPRKCSMQALNIVFDMRDCCDARHAQAFVGHSDLGSVSRQEMMRQDQFDTKVYGIVIQSLVEEPGPLPTLFMRTVIQVARGSECEQSCMAGMDAITG